ncbi:MAG: DUF59 domain-containing protein [Verrucomicrobia bacterium]|nr:DUF59 domain-containing protein [Verrucomicrobiota bacterium]
MNPESAESSAGTPKRGGASSGGPDSTPPSLEERVWEQLRDCYDPEIPLNIVDLGLIYGVALQGERVDVKMTLTSPGCHLGGMIAGQVQSKLLELEGVEEANVELVWDPPWHQGLISAEGRRRLGLELA